MARGTNSVLKRGWHRRFNNRQSLKVYLNRRERNKRCKTRRANKLKGKYFKEFVIALIILVIITYLLNKT